MESFEKLYRVQLQYQACIGIWSSAISISTESGLFAVLDMCAVQLSPICSALSVEASRMRGRFEE